MKSKLQHLLTILFIIGGVISTGLIAEACTDFSGKYRSIEEGHNELFLTFTQIGCERLIMDYKYADGSAFRKDILLDGVSRVIFDESNFKTTEAFSWGLEDIFFIAHLENKMSGRKHIMKGSFMKDIEGNIIEDKTFYNLNGKRLYKVIVVHTQQ